MTKMFWRFRIFDIIIIFAYSWLRVFDRKNRFMIGKFSCVHKISYHSFHHPLLFPWYFSLVFLDMILQKNSWKFLHKKIFLQNIVCAKTRFSSGFFRKFFGFPVDSFIKDLCVLKSRILGKSIKKIMKINEKYFINHCRRWKKWISGTFGKTTRLLMTVSDSLKGSSTWLCRWYWLSDRISCLR